MRAQPRWTGIHSHAVSGVACSPEAALRCCHRGYVRGQHVAPLDLLREYKRLIQAINSVSVATVAGNGRPLRPTAGQAEHFDKDGTAANRCQPASQIVY